MPTKQNVSVTALRITAALRERTCCHRSKTSCFSSTHAFCVFKNHLQGTWPGHERIKSPSTAAAEGATTVKLGKKSIGRPAQRSTWRLAIACRTILATVANKTHDECQELEQGLPKGNTRTLRKPSRSSVILLAIAAANSACSWSSRMPVRRTSVTGIRGPD